MNLVDLDYHSKNWIHLMSTNREKIAILKNLYFDIIGPNIYI